MAMNARLARFYPSSFGLAARIGLILVGAVVLSIGISTAFIFIVGEGEGQLPVISAETMADKILEAYRRIDSAPVPERADPPDRLAGAAATAGIRHPAALSARSQRLPPERAQ